MIHSVNDLIGTLQMVMMEHFTFSYINDATNAGLAARA